MGQFVITIQDTNFEGPGAFVANSPSATVRVVDQQKDGSTATTAIPRFEIDELPTAGTSPIARVTFEYGSEGNPYQYDEIDFIPDVTAVSFPYGADAPVQVKAYTTFAYTFYAVDQEGRRGPAHEYILKQVSPDETSDVATAMAITDSGFNAVTSIDEGAGIGSVVGYMSSNGVPQGDFSIVTQSPANKLDIQGDNTVVVNDSLDFDANDTQTVTFRVTNGAGTYDQEFVFDVTEQTGGVAPGTAIHQSVIGPAAQYAAIRTYVPPSSVTTTVNNASELTTAVNNASPGDIIRLNSGNYGDWTTRRNNAGAKIRLVAASYLGPVFDQFRNYGRGFSVEGMRSKGYFFLGNGGNGRPEETGFDSDYKNCRGIVFLARNFENVGVYDCVFDTNFSEQSSFKSGSGVVVRRTIFCNANAGDNVQVSDTNDMDFENCVFFRNRYRYDGGTHSDLFQSYFPRETGTQKWRFHKCMFWNEERETNRGTQGLFLSDGRYDGLDVQYCITGKRTRKGRGPGNGFESRAPRPGIIISRGSGVIADNTVMHRIDINYGNGITVRDNICTKVFIENGSATVTGNYTYGQGNEDSEFSKTNGHTYHLGWDPRDYLTAGSNKGATSHINNSIVGFYGA